MPAERTVFAGILMLQKEMIQKKAKQKVKLFRNVFHTFYQTAQFLKHVMDAPGWRVRL